MVTVAEDHLKELERKVEDLKTHMEISSIISSTLDLDELMNIVMERAKAEMDAEACSILFYNKETNKLEFEVAMCDERLCSDTLKKKIMLDISEGIAGWVARNREPLFVEDVRADSRFYRGADNMTGFNTKSLIAVPLIGRGGLIGVVEVINPRNKDYNMWIFRLLCRQFAISIENSLFHRDSIARERVRQELEIAAAVQKSFLPDSPVFEVGDLKVSAINISAAQVGGDVYDFVLSADGKAGVLIGDVSGKGVSGALYMAKAISDFRYIAREENSPELVLNRLNCVLSKSPRGMFLTAIYLMLDPATGDVTAAAAGHPPILWLTSNEVKVLSVPSGPPLGILPTEYPATTFRLERGDRLILLTDGVFDAKNKAGQRLGFDSVVAFVRQHIEDPEILEAITGYVDDFSHGTERADDLTLLELRWGKPE